MSVLKNIQIAIENSNVIKRGEYIKEGSTKYISTDVNLAIENTKLYKSEEVSRLSKQIQEILQSQLYETLIEVTPETTTEACYRLIEEGVWDVVCLNFASAVVPGGGYLTGSSAQEECLARASALYHCLLTQEEYYNHNKSLNSTLYSDYIIYSPKVPFFRDDKHEFLASPVKISVITAPAVNKKYLKREEKVKVDIVMENRIDKILALAVERGHETLVLGAWGCGVFKNNPKKIAISFRSLLEGKYKGAFKKVVFAIPRNKDKNLETFKNILV